MFNCIPATTILLISTELAVIVIRFAVMESTVSSGGGHAQAYNHLPGITRLFKVGTLVFYMTTMLLAARLAMATVEEKLEVSNQNPKIC